MSVGAPTSSTNSNRSMLEISRRALLGGAVMSHAMGQLKRDYRIIDPHVHVWKHDPKYPFAEGAHPPERDATPEMLLSLMNANGVARTVIIQVIHYKYDNSYLAEALQRYPRIFRGVCPVDPLAHAAPHPPSPLTQQGFRGVRLRP